MNEFFAKNRHLVAGFGAICGLLLAIIYREMTSLPSEIAPQVNQPQETPEQLVERHLKWADVNCIAVVGQEVQPVGMFFSDVRSNTRRFAEVALGSESKWMMVKDFFTGRSEHSAFMRERFEAMLFSQADLDALVQGVVAAHLRHEGDVESQLLLKIEADMASLSQEMNSGFVDQETLAQRLDSALRDAMTAAQGSLQTTVGREIVSLIAGEVLGNAAISLATSSGILGVGATTTAATWGASLIACYIVDVVVSAIYQELYDPVGELTKQLDSHLSGLERLIVEGTPEAPGLVTRLRECASRRGSIRREAIRAAVFPAAM